MAATRRSTVQTSVANDRDGEMECSWPCDTETQACCWIRASSTVYPEDLSQAETIELETQGEVPQTYRSRWLDCLFGLASYVEIAVDKAKAAGTEVSLMDSASQEEGSARVDSHKRPNRSSGQKCGPNRE